MDDIVYETPANLEFFKEDHSYHSNLGNTPFITFTEVTDQTDQVYQAIKEAIKEVFLLIEKYLRITTYLTFVGSVKNLTKKVVSGSGWV